MAEKQKLFKQKALKELSRQKQRDALHALELLVGPEVEMRMRGLRQLLELDAHRRSPLTAAILASRVDEPDLILRTEILKALSESIASDQEMTRLPESVRRWMREALGRMRRREIYALLQVIAASAENLDPVCHVLDACSFSGDALILILNDRKADVTIRVAAAKAIGKVGFVEAEPVLQSLSQRIASRSAGQMEMAFAPVPDHESETLLPAVLEALRALEDRSD